MNGETTIWKKNEREEKSAKTKQLQDERKKLAEERKILAQKMRKIAQTIKNEEPNNINSYYKKTLNLLYFGIIN